jgi:TIR domain
MPESFDVFLCHNNRDKPVVRELGEALRARELKVWLDEWELVPGRRWPNALEKVIETCRAAAVLVCKDGLGPWQTVEMESCLREFVRRNLPVIPLLLPGAPEAPELPLFLRSFHWVDLRGGLSEEGIDQLQWGITGERPDRAKLESSSTAPHITETVASLEVSRSPNLKTQVL